MADIVDRKTRSRMMAGIRGGDTKPEVAVRRFLHGRGLRFRLRSKGLPGKPDIVLPKYRAVVFVHGCFWHRHARCPYAYVPKTRRQFWMRKFASNAERDLVVTRELASAGWGVYVIWECEVDDQKKLSALFRNISSGPR